MGKSCMKFVKGAMFGMAVGTAMSIAGCRMMRNKKKIKRKASRAVHAVGDLIDNVQYMFG